MNHLEGYNSFGNNTLSEDLLYHIENKISLFESVYRIESDSWLNLVIEARNLYNENKIILSDDEIWLIGTDVGIKESYEGKEVIIDVPFTDDDISEAEYRGRKVKINKPFRTTKESKKFGVYTYNDKRKVVKVSFGQKGMRVNNNDPKKARSFQKRMRCENPGPKWKPRYWSCNVARYRKLLGIKSNNPW
jgi:hypothetical protein